MKAIELNDKLVSDLRAGLIRDSFEYRRRRQEVYSAIHAETVERHKGGEHNESSCWMCQEEARVVMDSSLLVRASSGKGERINGIQV